MAIEETMTKEEKVQLERDIETMKAQVASQVTTTAVQKAKEEGRTEALREAEVKQQLAMQEAKAKELADKLAAQEKAANDRLAEMQKKMDSLIESKAVTRPTDNPFNSSTTSGGHPVDKLSESDLDKIEQESAKAFYGASYDAVYRYEQ